MQVRALGNRYRTRPTRIAKLAAGDSLALPPEVTAYLDRMRALGAPEGLVELERDAWILIAAQWPERIADYMVDEAGPPRRPVDAAFPHHHGRRVHR